MQFTASAHQIWVVWEKQYMQRRELTIHLHNLICNNVTLLLSTIKCLNHRSQSKSLVLCDLTKLYSGCRQLLCDREAHGAHHRWRQLHYWQPSLCSLSLRVRQKSKDTSESSTPCTSSYLSLWGTVPRTSIWALVCSTRPFPLHFLLFTILASSFKVFILLFTS